MGEMTKISWCDATFNPWFGCTNVSAGCDHCYAEAFTHRMGLEVWGKDSPRQFFGEKHWNEPLKWNRKAKESGVRQSVFCGSMCDILDGWFGEVIFSGKGTKEFWTDRLWDNHSENPLDTARRYLWNLIEETEWLDWLLLSKRPQRFKQDLPIAWLDNPRKNVNLMTTVESPEYVWRVADLLAVPAKLHSVSWEPALNYVDFTRYMPIRCCNGEDCCCRGLPVEPPPYLDWVIAGGESGAGCRPFDIEWARMVRDDCKRNGVAYFLKQLGGFPDKRMNPSEWPIDLRVQEFPLRFS